MIRINKYKVCRITGETDIDATLFSPEENTVEKRFATEDEAIVWIEDEQAAELAISIVNWVHHKHHIAEHSDWYRSSDRKQAFLSVQPMLDEIMKWKLHSAVVEVLNHQTSLYKLLPAPGNNSFEASKMKLDEMIAFCNRRLKQMKLKKIS